MAKISLKIQYFKELNPNNYVEKSSSKQLDYLNFYQNTSIHY